MSTRRAGLVLLALAAAAASVRADEPVATLPTPYTAEQIRDAWRTGFVLEQRTRLGEVESGTRMTATAWSDERVTVRVETLDSSGKPSEPPVELVATWEELRDHALFEAATTTRERAICHSRLGAQDGWLYRRPAADGATEEICFADATPGPPAEFGSKRDGAWLSRTEHVSYASDASAQKAKKAP